MHRQADIQGFWEQVKPSFAHVKLEDHLPDYDELTCTWEQQWINDIDFVDKVVVDYGIGAAWLGKYLLESKGIKRYTGVDIALRSLRAAGTNLREWGNVNLIHADDFYETFKEPIDVFVSQACIQHFPDQQYLDRFLNRVKLLDPVTIMLQIAHHSETVFDPSRVVRACRTNAEYISEKLGRKIQKVSMVEHPKDYCFIIL